MNEKLRENDLAGDRDDGSGSSVTVHCDRCGYREGSEFVNRDVATVIGTHNLLEIKTRRRHIAVHELAAVTMHHSGLGAVSRL